MVDFALVLNFAVAIAVGALIGLEREHAQHLRKFKTFAGIRTFTLISLFGALAAFFSKFSILILVTGFVGVVVFAASAYYPSTHVPLCFFRDVPGCYWDDDVDPSHYLSGGNRFRL